LELNSSLEKQKKEKFLINNIEQKLEDESKKAIEKMDALLTNLQSQILKTSPNRKNEKLNEIKALKEENDNFINNINALKQEQLQITEKYNKLKSKYSNASQRPQNTNENSKSQLIQ
jgi:hypothetical protein